MSSVIAVCKKSAAILCLSLLLCLVFFAASPPSMAQAALTGWNQQTSGTTQDFLSVSAVDSNTAWAGGSDGLFKTTNGGATWTKQPGLASGSYLVDAVNPWVVWVCGPGVIQRTVDGGASWTVVYQGNNTPAFSYGAVAVEALDANTAWASFVFSYNYGSVCWAEIRRTEDAGATWNTQKTYDGLLQLTGHSAVDSKTAWFSRNVFITKTSDGTTWNHQFMPLIAPPGIDSAFSGINSLDAYDKSSAWAVGSLEQSTSPKEGVILRTTDGGIGWKSQDSHVARHLTGVSAVGENTAWAVGNSGTIVKTTDGENWETQASGVATDLASVSAVDASTAWAVGKGGVILHTTDGGGNPVAHPRLDSIAPDEGEAGVELTLTGSGFGSEQGSSYVSIGKVTRWSYGYPVVEQAAVAPAEYTSWSDTQIKCTVPASDPGVLKVRVVVGNYASETLLFNRPACTVVTSISPYSGINNSTVDIGLSGYGFSAPNLALEVKDPASGASIPVTDVVVVSDRELACRLDLTGQPAEVYDVLISGDWPAVQYLQGFKVLEPSIEGINPSYGANLWQVQVTISGEGLLPGASVRLERDTTIISATDVTVVSGTQLTCNFDLRGKSLGRYDVVVVNPGGSELRLQNSFSVTDICGQGAGASISVFAATLGLMSIMGMGFRRRRKGT